MKTAIILAAGESKRLGRPKQLLSFGEQTLIQRVIRNAHASGVDDVLVVTGAFAEAVEENIRDEECRVVYNADWAEGIGSSIRCAARKLKGEAECPDFVLLLLCDQPFISPSHLQELTAASANPPSSIAATLYPDGAKGIPACFPAKYLDDLSSHRGTVGAKQLILKHCARYVRNELASIDIDTERDVDDHLAGQSA